METTYKVIKYKRGEIYIFDTVEDMSKYVTQRLIDASMNNEAGMVSCALSGGTTPVSLFRELAKSDPRNVFLRNILWFWGDERMVRPTDKESNFKLACENYFDHVSTNFASVFRIWGEDDPTTEQARYARVLDGILPKINGRPQFDYILLGMGTDGHTASIFPDRTDLFESELNVASVVHPQSKQNRITLTGPVINSAKNVLMLVTGKEKSDIIRKVVFEEGTFSQYPVSLVEPKAGKLIWCIDKAAASML